MLLRCCSKKWRNWQTCRTQNPLVARPCGFDSLLRHQIFGGIDERSQPHIFPLSDSVPIHRTKSFGLESLIVNVRLACKRRKRYSPLMACYHIEMTGNGSEIHSAVLDASSRIVILSSDHADYFECSRRFGTNAGSSRSRHDARCVPYLPRCNYAVRFRTGFATLGQRQALC